MSQQAPNTEFSADKQTKKVVTPFAFNVDESLLGQRLATPRRRFAAILIDLLCVGLLSLLSSIWLSIIILLVVANALWHIRNESGKTWAKFSLLLAGLLAGFILAFQLFVNDSSSEDVQQSDADVVQSLEFSSDEYSLKIDGLASADGPVCFPEAKCGEQFFGAAIGDMANNGLAYDDAKNTFQDLKQFLRDNNKLDPRAESLEFSEPIYHQLIVESGETSSGVGVLDWAAGIVEDLGTSFGWAALYFSTLTAWWNGQTLGKRLFGIKVVRIDGKPIDLWESVGRYGGYSAGLATGLLGFIQIYWDGNRQTIQDKISETLVIRP